MRTHRHCIVVVLFAGFLQGCAIRHDDRTGAASVAGAGSIAQIDFSDPVLNQRKIFLVGHITEATAAIVIRQLHYLSAQNRQAIDLYLMTPGGDLKAAFAVERAMRLIKAPVNTYALGDCNSGGAMLLAAGTGERQAFDDSIIVIHGMVIRNRPPARYVELTQDTYTAFWRRRARLPESWVPIPPGKVFILTAQQALEYGVVDRIIARPRE